MDSSETLATLGTRHRTLEKTVEGNDEWTVQTVLCLVANVVSVSGLSIHHCPLRFSMTFYVLVSNNKTLALFHPNGKNTRTVPSKIIEHENCSF
jgi:hypothetical protein